MREEIEKKLYQILYEVLGDKGFHKDIHNNEKILDYAECTSLQAIEIIAYIENEFEIEIEDEYLGLNFIETIDSMREFIESKLGIENNQCEFTVVIPTYNKKNRLKYLLKSIELQDAKDSFRVIIVDDGSTDTSKELVQTYTSKFDLTYIHIENSGRSHARNVGLQKVDTKYVIFCDDDMILPKNFITEHKNLLNSNPKTMVHGRIYNLPYLSFFEDPETGTLYPQYENENLTHVTKFLIRPEDIYKEEQLKSQRRMSMQEKYVNEIASRNMERLLFLLCTGGNFSCETNVLKDIGGFNEEIDLKWGTEDLELGYRLQKAGIHMIYSEEAYNYHICHYRETYKEDMKESCKKFYEIHQDPLVLELPKLFLKEVSSLDEFMVDYMNE